MVALFATGRVALPIPEIPVHGPLWPSGTKLYVEPSSGVDDVDPTVDVPNSVQHCVRQLWNNQNFDPVHNSHEILALWQTKGWVLLLYNLRGPGTNRSLLGMITAQGNERNNCT